MEQNWSIFWVILITRPMAPKSLATPLKSVSYRQFQFFGMTVDLMWIVYKIQRMIQFAVQKKLHIY